MTWTFHYNINNTHIQDLLTSQLIYKVGTMFCFVLFFYLKNEDEWGIEQLSDFPKVTVIKQGAE